MFLSKTEFNLADPDTSLSRFYVTNKLEQYEKTSNTDTYTSLLLNSEEALVDFLYVN